MGWIYALNPFVGVFVYEVEESAGKPPNGKETMIVHGIEKCSDTGNDLAYRVWEVYATKAEATEEMNREKVMRTKWRTRDKEIAQGKIAARMNGKPLPRLLHFLTQRYAWKGEKYFQRARKKKLALCQVRAKTGTIFTTESDKVTCSHCLSWMRGYEEHHFHTGEPETWQYAKSA